MLEKEKSSSTLIQKKTGTKPRLPIDENSSSSSSTSSSGYCNKNSTACDQIILKEVKKATKSSKRNGIQKPKIFDYYSAHMSNLVEPIYLKCTNQKKIQSESSCNQNFLKLDNPEKSSGLQCTADSATSSNQNNKRYHTKDRVENAHVLCCIFDRE